MPHTTALGGASMFAIVIIIALMVFSILFRIAGVLRLSIPLLYALIVPTLFHGWYYAHYSLANGIWYAMLVLCAFSWVITVIHRLC